MSPLHCRLSRWPHPLDFSELPPPGSLLSPVAMAALSCSHPALCSPDRLKASLGGLGHRMMLASPLGSTAGAGLCRRGHFRLVSVSGAHTTLVGQSDVSPAGSRAVNGSLHGEWVEVGPGPLLSRTPSHILPGLSRLA